jgi:hypothetical protein
MVFYSHASVGLVLIGLWVLFYHDHPSSVKHVTTIELEKIHRNKTKAHIEMDSYIPYKVSSKIHAAVSEIHITL